MLEANQFICLLLAVSILRTKDIYGALQRRAHANRSIDVKDRIIEIQCYAKCFKSSPENCQECERKCRIDMTKAPRPGKCPSIITSNHISACIDACQYDFDCSETQKCCRSTCGPVCHDAVGLDKDLSLPPIPKIIAYQLPKGKRVCEVKIQASANSVYAYHVEARHHVGSLFSARKLGSWQWQAVERIAEFNANKTRITGISFKVKPGRWYEFRVAAINANGFRGYTESSKPFTLSNQNIRADPKPPRKPQSLQVLSSKMVDGLMSIRVAWCSPKSDLPIEKYRLIWALYVQSDDDSLIAKEIFVKDANQFEITRLVPDSCYYIQVQAISINGRRRLKSEKISLLFNTTTTTLVQNGKLQCSNHKTSKDVSTSAAGSNMLDDRATNPIKTTSKFVVNFRSSKKFVLIVQISGFYPQKGRLIEICAGDFNCENPEYGAIRPKKDFIEFDKLKFNTTYTIRAIDPSGNGKGSENDFRTNCTELFENCVWESIAFDCCSEFLPLKTEYGVCYSFNSNHARNVWRAKYSTNRETGPGRLQFFVSRDVQVHIHPPMEIPFFFSDGVFRETVLWGTSQEIVFDVVEIYNDPSVLFVEPEKRRCRFSYELHEDFKLYKFYSYSTCVVECMRDLSLYVCNCTDHFLSSDDNGLICNEFGLDCLTENYNIMREQRKECNCLSTCEEPEYNIIYNSAEGATEDEIVMSKVLISMMSLPWQRYVRIESKNNLDLLISAGGIAGLFFGASFIKAFELIVYILKYKIRIFHILRQKMKCK